MRFGRGRKVRIFPKLCRGFGPEVRPFIRVRSNQPFVPWRDPGRREKTRPPRGRETRPDGSLRGKMELLDLDLRAGILELLLDRGGLVLRDAFLDGAEVLDEVL